MGYVGPQKQRTPFRRSRTTTNPPLGDWQPDTTGTQWWSTETPKRCPPPVMNTKRNHLTVPPRVKTTMAWVRPHGTAAMMDSWIREIPWQTMFHEDMAANSSTSTHDQQYSIWLSKSCLHGSDYILMVCQQDNIWTAVSFHTPVQTGRKHDNIKPSWDRHKNLQSLSYLLITHGC